MAEKEGIRFKLHALEHEIFRLQAGGYDGYVESLLNRYGLINDLPDATDAKEVSDGVACGDYELLLDSGGFLLKKNGIELIKTLPGTQAATAPTFHSNEGFSVKLPVAKDEKLIGLGDQVRNRFLLNGQKDELWIRYPVKHIPVPFFMSSRGYGLFFNTTRRLLFDVESSKTGEAKFVVHNQMLDLYLLPGETYDEMIQKYCRLTGFPAIPPLKSFGLWLIMHTQATGHDVLNVARALRQANIPCDNLSLEPNWMEQSYDFTVNKEWAGQKFRGCPTGGFRRGPDRMMDALKRMGFELGLWLCTRWDCTWEEERRAGSTRLERESELSLNGIELSHFDENVGHKPIYMDENTVRDEPWFEHLKKFVDDGARFFKVDPAALINEFPDRLYGNGKTDDEMHNIASLLCSKQMAHDYEAHTGRRSYGISVAGWAGQQRYAGTWAGDTGGGPQPLVGILQNAIIGHAYATCDMKTDSPDGLHMGFFLPWSLINSWTSFHYPGFQGDVYDRMYRDYSSLRMRLLPFFYGLARRASTTGKAMARPLCLEYPQSNSAYEILTEFMLGDAFLVSVYQDEKVTLPSGRWLDRWSGEIHEGMWREAIIPFPANRGGHFFMKEGGIVPTIDVMQHVHEKPIERIIWQVFPGSTQTSFRLYLDDGDSLAYRRGAYAECEVTMTPDEDGFMITFGEVMGDEPERIRGIKHHVEVFSRAVETVSVNGKSCSFTNDGEFGNAITGEISAKDRVKIKLHPQK